VNYLVMSTFLRYQYHAVAHILGHLVNLASGPKSGFKNKCQVRACLSFRAGFWFQNKARLQLWVAGHLHFDKDLHFCFIADFNINYEPQGRFTKKYSQKPRENSSNKTCSPKWPCFQLGLCSCSAPCKLLP